MTRWNRRVRREQSRSPDKLHSNVEVEVMFCDVVAKPFKTAECRMTFIAVINCRLNIQCVKHPDTADTEQNLLLDTHLAVTAVKLSGDSSVFRSVFISISVKQIQTYSSDIDFPHLSNDVSAWERNAYCHPVTFRVTHRLKRKHRELLRQVL